MPKYIFSNRASATLAAAITSTATSIPLSAGQGALFPVPGPNEAFHVTIVDASGNSEIVRCTARSGDILTVIRGVENTVPRAFAGGSRVELRLTAEVVSSFIQGNVLPPLGANLDFGGYAPVNVNWSVVSINAAQLSVSNIPVVLTNREITVGPGMSGGGPLSNNIAISLRFANQAEAQDPNITDRVIAPAHLNMFTSPAFTWIEPLVPNVTIYTYVHNLNKLPLVYAGLRCRVNNNGYQVGDVININAIRRGENNSLPVVVLSSTQVRVLIPTNCKFLSLSNPGALVDLLENNWELHVRGWRL